MFFHHTGHADFSLNYVLVAESRKEWRCFADKKVFMPHNEPLLIYTTNKSILYNSISSIVQKKN